MYLNFLDGFIFSISLALKFCFLGKTVMGVAPAAVRVRSASVDAIRVRSASVDAVRVNEKSKFVKGLTELLFHFTVVLRGISVKLFMICVNV